MKVKRLASTLALSLLLSACGVPGATANQPILSPAPFSLAVLGDSLSAGQYLPDSSYAYPRLLANDLHASLTVYARAGNTTAQTRGMYSGKLTPTYAVIELGTNDYNRGVPLAKFAASYQRVVASIAPATRVVCLSVWDPVDAAGAIWSSPLGVPSPVNRVGATPAAYNAIIRQLCSGTYVSLQSLYDTPTYHGSGSPGALYHPNIAGAAAIARLVYAAFSS
jgi:lysophospholipase L1-like esterase